MLTRVGAKSGKLCKTALMRAELRRGAAKRGRRAAELTGAEKASSREGAAATWQDYASYQHTTDRQIPVFVLEPMRSRSRFASHSCGEYPSI